MRVRCFEGLVIFEEKRFLVVVEIWGKLIFKKEKDRRKFKKKYFGIKSDKKTTKVSIVLKISVSHKSETKQNDSKKGRTKNR